MTLSAIFLLAMGLVGLFILGVLIHDVLQTRDAVLRNYPVVGHLRYILSALGEFLREYFFAMDREQLPFNRAEREWVRRATKDKHTTIAFGSTKSLLPVGSLIFENGPFPTLDEDAAEPSTLVIGEGYCDKPYATASLFNISAMSFGAISAPAVRALSRGARQVGCWYNTGEGGLATYHLEGGADLVFQLGSAKYGVRNLDGSFSAEKLRDVAAHEQVKMFEIKLSQGAKPGKGGILPAAKVTQQIADIRGITVARDSISPNRHREINSAGELLDFIHRVRHLTGKPTGFKAVLGSTDWLHILFTEVNRRGRASAPDFISLDSGDGGSGAAPMALMDNVGLPIKETLPQLVDLLWHYGLRDRIKVVTSGKLITPTGVAWALCAGADFIASARGFMFALGCIQSLRCNQNTCPTGITTHNKRLQNGLVPHDKAARVAHYVKNINRAVKIIAHSCGVQEPRQLQRQHVRLVGSNGRSVRMSELYPPVA